MAGAVVLVIEIQGARLLAPVWGSTVYVWSSLITVTMAALSLGYILGGKLIDSRPGHALLYVTVIATGVATFLALPALPSIYRVTEGLGIVWGPLAATTLIFGLPLTLLAMVTPISLKLYVEELKSLGATSGWLYAIGTAGSLLGSLLSGFVFASHFSALNVFHGTALFMVVWGGIGLAMTAFLEAYATNLRIASIVVPLLILAVIAFQDPTRLMQTQAGVPEGAALLTQTPDREEVEGRDARSAIFAPPSAARIAPSIPSPTGFSSNGMPQFPIIFSSRGTTEANVVLHERSFYGDVMVFDFAEHVRCFMIDGANESCWNFERKLPSEYVHDMAYILTNSGREVRDVLVIGSGAGTFSKYLDSEGHHDISVDNVEINPVMGAVAERYFGLAENVPTTTTIDDGRHFLGNATKKYDVIILDICYVNQANVHLWTKEFFALAKAHLKDPENGLIMASRGISNDPSSDRLDHMVANALSTHFTNIYSAERINRAVPNDFGMGVFIASGAPVALTETGGRIGSVAIRSFDADATQGISSDDGHGLILQLSAGATDGIRRQTRENFGERLLMPL